MEVTNSVKPILRQIVASVNSGLNAVLTPRDCKILFLYIRTLEAKKPRTRGSLIEIIESELEGLKEEVIEQILRKGKP